MRHVANDDMLDKDDNSREPGRSQAAPPLAPLPLQAAMIHAARNGDAPWANLEQLVVRDPAPSPAAHVVARALDTLARRHEGLRLVAAEDAPGNPVFIARGRPVPAFATRDWSTLDAPAQEAALTDWLADDRAQGFDLAASPGWRVLLADLGAQGHACVLSVHHALLDGPAMAVVIEELYELIGGRGMRPAPGGDLRGVRAALDRLPADAAERAARLLGGFDRPAHLAGPDGQTPGRMQAQIRRLKPRVSAALRTRARDSGGTFAMVQAAWALVLARWTGEDDLAFGLTLAGRNLVPGAARTVGCLIATLPQRIRLSGLGDIDTLARQLRAQTRDLRDLHAAPTEELRRWAGLAPGMALYDNVLVFSPRTVGAALAGLGGDWDRRRAQLIEEGDMPLTVAIYDEPELLVVLEHDPARVPVARARRLADHLTRLLAAIAASAPGAALGDLAMIPPDEAQRLDRLSRPDRTGAAAPVCLAGAIADLARLSPAAPALIDGDRRLDRAALDGKANALAHALLAAVPPGGLVALSLPRGAGYAVAVLACLKARLPFAPFDPAQPPELCAELARAAGARGLVAAAPLPGLDLPLFAPLAPPRGDAPDLPPTRGPEDFAYLIHTSGTTGTPKGVMGRASALAAHAGAVIDAYALTPEDRVLALAAPGFDVALEELLPTLAAGATLVYEPPAALASIPALLATIAAERITVLNLPASLWHLLADELHRRRLRPPASVRLVVAGSERIAPGALALWQRLAPGIRWMNAYGPTETTITALAYELPPNAPAVDPEQDVPVGRPLAHARAQVLAFDGSPAPEGAPGQLWIGGPAVTLGYLNRPAETEAAFRPAGEGGKLYATGDRAQWRPDGQLGFLGRRDRQVKLRGHRIDLGGIERVLGAQDGVREVHVGLDAGGERLVAWLAGPIAGAGEAALARLRAQVARRLHGPSLPALVTLPALPLRPNGKIDPARLPAPAAIGAPARNAGPEAGPAPGNLDEVAAIFARILKLDGVDPDTDFRDLGGHSLTALRLAGAIETRFGRRTRTTDLYRHPTARQLAVHLAAPAEGPKYVVPIQPLGAGVPFFAVHVLGEKESLFRPLAAALGPDRPVLGLTMGPPKDPSEVDVRSVARAYFDDIQRHYPTGPVTLGAVSMAAYFAYELAQQLMAAGREVRLLAVFDATGPGGRPSLEGRARLRAHLAQVRRRGLGHLAGVLRTRLNRLRFARDLALSREDEVNGAVLVLANVRAVEAYVPAPYLGRIAVFRADDSFWDSPAALDSALGWAAVARGELKRFDIPGDHLTILQDGNADRIAEHLKRLLPLD